MSGHHPAMASDPVPAEGDRPRKTVLRLQSDRATNQGSRVLGRIMAEKKIRNSVVHNALKLAWSRYGLVQIKEVDECTMSFKYDNEREQDQIMDLSHWSVQGHCLNLRLCRTNMCVEDVEFSTMQVWIQIYGLSLDIINVQNAQRIGSNLGKCIETEPAAVMSQMTYLRLKLDINVAEPLKAGF